MSAQVPVETVNHPAHYQSESGVEVIDVIERYELDFSLGNAIKYLLRAGKKGNEVEDLRKASWYADRFLARYLNADAEEPLADEETLCWKTPEEIVTAFHLTGDRGAAVEAILSIAVFAFDDVAQQIAAAIVHIEQAIKEAAA